MTFSTENNVNESFINDIKSTDINLNSFKPKDELNPKFWINNKLNSRVRLRLLDIADDFIKELSINWIKPKDIVFTGSLANYNWSKYSDIDIHILVDYDSIYKKHDFVEDYFKMKKDIWSDEHPNLKIYGFPVELYVEDINNDGVSSGVYSLEKNKWIVEPGDIQDSKLNEKYIKKVAAKFMTTIDEIAIKLKKETDNHKVDVYRSKLSKIFDKIKNLRKEGLKNGGEMSSGNIIFKILRRTNYFDKLWDLMNTSYDRLNSIKESKGRTVVITEEQQKLLEDKKLLTEFYKGKLYHSTTLAHLWSILKSNYIYKNTDCDDGGLMKGEFISLSRTGNPKLCYKKTVNPCIIEMDSEALMNRIRNAKLKPFSFDGEYTDKLKTFEYEERFYGDIKNLSGLAESIDIYINNIDECDYEYCDEVDDVYDILQQQGIEEPTGKDINMWFLQHIMNDFPLFKNIIHIHGNVKGL